MERIWVLPGTDRRERVQIKPRLRVERASLSYLEERGWVREGNRYRGQYRTSHGNWWGEAQPEDAHLNFFIYTPPTEVLAGVHAQCFQHIGNNWWWVHFYRESPNASDGVLEIERVIEEALGG